MHNERASNSLLDHVWLEITRKCNVACVHCYADSDPHQPLISQMTTSDWLKVIHESRELGARTIQFIGGEPLLHPDIDHLLTMAAEEAFDEVQLFTNSTMVTTAKAKWLRERDVVVHTSFYASEPEVHDEIVRKPGAFARTVAALSRMTDAGLRVRVALVDVGQGEGRILSAKEFLAATFRIREVTNDQARAFGRLASEQGDDVEAGLCGACHRGRLCVTASGDVYPCIMARHVRLGSAVDGSLREALLSTVRGAFVDRQRKRFAQSTSPKPRSHSDPCAPDLTPCSPDSGNCGPANCSPQGGCSPSAPYRTEVLM